MLRIYFFKAKGKAMAATITVVAGSETSATHQARAWCKMHELDATSLELQETDIFDPPCVVHGWDGDY